MPKKQQTRKPTAGRNIIQEMLERSRALDRRRQAQIANQAQSITRLLNNGSYSEEMRILHGAYADAAAESAELRTALTELVSAIDGTPLDGVSWGSKTGREALAGALAQARALVAPSTPQTSQEASAG